MLGGAKLLPELWIGKVGDHGGHNVRWEAEVIERCRYLVIGHDVGKDQRSKHRREGGGDVYEEAGVGVLGIKGDVARGFNNEVWCGSATKIEA